MNRIKKTKLFILGGLLSTGIVLMSADHLDAPDVAGTTADITDFYAFEGANPDNTVFVVNVQSSLAPAGDSATFDENVLVEINIDNNGDLTEDLVIQAIPRNGIMYFFGPYTPSVTGLNSTINKSTDYLGQVEISTGANATISSSNGISYFAGLREDSFFFDFSQYNAIIGGMAPNGFNVPGNDDFDGTNVLSITLEVPNSLLGGTFDHPAGTGTQVFNTWVEAKTKQ
ncbi:DUF4331 family protein [Aquimarina muelleri]|uniref:Molecular chaperone DnaK n=1 Tax=Aquimarina muelleri TaxID=279356 RepID=A0A918JZ72_9FLAO|nr:DUF4331 family protein [Aquimarina muelleri]GGX34968.1 hypothetical protein GCM10007384_39250 [Aquimarina muelleri]